MAVHINPCRCGAKPAIAAKDITGVDISYAIHCSQYCGDDSHWQGSLTEAVRRWNAGLVRAARGGFGSPKDDEQKAS